MNTLNLSLRQRKLLHILQSSSSCITGPEAARQLNVSSRTIRNDIAEINQSLLPFHAQILSEGNKGYLFSAEDPEAIRQMNQVGTAFFTKEDRVRYLAIQLCLSDIPINMYDLEEEMYISRTTLDHDLRHLKMKYVLSEPHMELNQYKDNLEFEHSERKRRMLLNRLLHEDWNYHTKGNAYYEYDFLNPDTLDLIMREIPVFLNRHSIQMEDVNLTALDLTIAIMYHRLLSGHPLPPSEPVPRPDTAAGDATEELMDSLEKKLKCTFPREERDEIYRNISSGHLMDVSRLNFETVKLYFEPVILEIADSYLAEIRNTFRIDFSNDEDFYITLLQYIRYLQTPVHIFNTQENMDIARDSLSVEYEIAFLFQGTSLRYLGYYLNSSELLYLAYCISGALEYLYHHHPEIKFRTVICSHLNLPAVWSLKRKLLVAFGNYLHMTALLPVNAKSAYDFQDTDLVLTTVRKEITADPFVDTIQISPFMTPSDHRKIESYIQKKRIRNLCPLTSPTLRSLLEEAFWHEAQEPSKPFTVIEQMAHDFLENGLVSETYLEDLLRRESISSFASHPGVLFLHTLVPATKTRLSVTTFSHSMNWKSHKIWIVAMAAFRPGEETLLFRLVNVFSEEASPAEQVKDLKTRDELIRYWC